MRVGMALAFFFKKVSSQMRNRIFGRRSLGEGRGDGVQQGGERVKDKKKRVDEGGDWVAQ